jgi:transcriptional regulator with XRE-family HTH domain
MYFICFMANKDEYIAQQLENLGKRLKDIRKGKGYSNYEQFAFDNEIPRAQYGRYEKGHDLRFSSLLKVLKAMDISLKDFFNKGFESK